MATTPTQNAVPSELPQDLKFNAGKIDEFVTSLAMKYIDRLGGDHYTIEGIKQLAFEAVSAFGYITISSFEDGATLTAPNQALLWESNGEYYKWTGNLPKTVPAGSTPDSTGGIGPGAWLSIGDSLLRSMLASSIGASNIGTTDGGTVQAELDDLDDKLPEINLRIDSSIKTSVQTLSAIKDESVSYDGFGNTLFYSGRNLFCFRRSPEHLDTPSGDHRICICEINKDGTYSIIWELSSSGIVVKEPCLSVSTPGNQLLISYQMHNVNDDTYHNSVIGYPDLSNSGAFISKSDILTAESYYLWGNVLTTPDGKFLTTRYKLDGSEVQLIKSSDTNLNAATVWNVSSTLTTSMFPLRTAINETSLSYYRGKLVAAVRTMATGQEVGEMGIAYTGDLTGASGWQSFVTSARYAGPRMEAYPEFDDPLVIIGTTYRTTSPGYRSDVSITCTYDISSFTTSRVVYSGEYFNCYASAKKISSGVYEYISFDEREGTAYTNIHRSYLYINQDAGTAISSNKQDWLQSVINNRPAYGSLSLVASTTNTSTVYFSFTERVSGITRIFLMIGPIASATTLTPLIKYLNGTTYATCFNVSLSANSNPQVIEIQPVNQLDIEYYGVLYLSLGSGVPVGCTSPAAVGQKLPIVNKMPFNMYNSVGKATSPYNIISFGKL